MPCNVFMSYNFVRKIRLNKKEGHLILLCKKKKVTNLQYISRWLVHYKVSYNANKWATHEGFPLSKIWPMKKICGKNIIDFSIFLSHVVWVFKKKSHIWDVDCVWPAPLLKIPGSATGHRVTLTWGWKLQKIKVKRLLEPHAVISTFTSELLSHCTGGSKCGRAWAGQVPRLLLHRCCYSK
jgi:hypothetical protein